MPKSIHKESGADDSGSSRLRINKDSYSLTDAGQRCTACGRMLPSDAVLCVDCGLLTDGSGRVTPVGTRRAGRRILVWATCAVVASASAVAAFKFGWVDFSRRKVAEVQERIARTQQSASSRRAQELLERLDREYPMLEKGDYAEIRQRSGRILRGRISALDEARVVIQTEAGIRDLVLTSLDGASRIRLDPEERQRMVDQAMQANESSTLDATMALMKGLITPTPASAAPSMPETTAPMEAPSGAVEAAGGRLDVTHPRYELNQFVVIVQRNGLVRRGTFKGIDGNMALLDTEGAVSISIPFSQLKAEDLIRVSEKHREEATRRMANK